MAISLEDKVEILTAMVAKLTRLLYWVSQSSGGESANELTELIILTDKLKAFDLTWKEYVDSDL